MTADQIYQTTKRHNEEINTRLQKLIEIIQDRNLEDYETRLRLTYELGRLSATVKSALLESEILAEDLANRLDRATHEVRAYA